MKICIFPELGEADINAAGFSESKTIQIIGIVAADAIAHLKISNITRLDFERFFKGRTGVFLHGGDR